MRKSVHTRAVEFGRRHAAKVYQQGEMMEGEEAKVRFWKWWGFLHGASFGWHRGYLAGKKASSR